MKKTIYLLVTGICMFGTYAIAQKFPDQDKWYYLVLEETGQRLKNDSVKEKLSSLSGLGSASTVLRTGPVSGNEDNYLWRFIRVGSSGNTYMIVNKKTGQYMDILKRSTNRGAPVILRNNNGEVNQQFHLVPAANNNFYISSVSSGHVLSITSKKEIDFEIHVAVNDNDKARTLRLLGLSGEKHQQWKLAEPLPDIKLQATSKPGGD